MVYKFGEHWLSCNRAETLVGHWKEQLQLLHISCGEVGRCGFVDEIVIVQAAIAGA